jgi:HK97 family phage portal protein
MKKEKRNLFNMFFGKNNQKQSVKQTRLEMLNSYNAEFTTLGNNTYDSKVARQCIDRIATHCAKLIPKHIQDNISNCIKGDINFLLQNMPNPIMTKFDFIYKTISMLYTDSNAFVYIAKDEKGFITGFYPVLAQDYDLLQDKEGKMYLKFKFVNGKSYILPYLELIHLRLFYNKHDIFGTNNKVLKTDIDTAHTASEGIKNAIKTSNNLKGILKYENSMLKDKDLKASKEAFVNDFLNLENESGIAAMDAKADFKEVNLKPITLDREQLEQVNYNIFDYFGISENIVRNNFTEEEWNAFFEGVIEPRSIQMSDAFTNKVFSIKARKEGHKIIFTANRLQYASLKTKILLLKEAGDRAMLKVDEGREIIDLPPIGGEEGNKIIQSLNYIDGKIANNYQGGNKDGESD